MKYEANDTIRLTLDSVASKIMKPKGQIHIKTKHGLLKIIDFEMDDGDQIQRIVVPAIFTADNISATVGTIE
jgi:hypothetical protein